MKCSRERQGDITGEQTCQTFLVLLSDYAPGPSNAIQRLNHYPVDSIVCFVNTYRLDEVLHLSSR